MKMRGIKAKHNIRTSPCYGGAQYHYDWDGETFTSFNYWPTWKEAEEAAIDEVLWKIKFRATVQEMCAALGVIKDKGV